MTNRPRLLDLFCCEGGAGYGYHLAGFDVTGVDLDPRFAKRYPFEFHAGDALEFIAEHGHEYDAIHASPPCPGYSVTTAGVPEIRARHPRLIPAVRDALRATGKHYVIENVVGARSEMQTPLLLCGSMFGLTATDDDGTPLRLERHRLFESDLLLTAPGPCRHDKSISVAGVYGGGRSKRRATKRVGRGGYTPAKGVRADLIGADWMTLHGLSQSIPPAYTEHLGRQLMDAVTVEDGAA